MRISDWSSDVCSSDLRCPRRIAAVQRTGHRPRLPRLLRRDQLPVPGRFPRRAGFGATQGGARLILSLHLRRYMVLVLQCLGGLELVLLAAGIAISMLYPLPSLELRADSAPITDTGYPPPGGGIHSETDRVG